MRRFPALFSCCAAVPLLVGCNQPTEPGPTPPSRNIVVADSAIVDITPYQSRYFVLDPNDFTTALMTIDPAIGNARLGSMVSDSNNTAMLRMFSAIDTGVIGAEFYIMAQSSARTNFIAFLGKDAGSSRNSMWYCGMGFDKSDSVKYVYSTELTVNEQSKNVAAIQFNHWYKCAIEFRFSDTTATYWLDGARVGEQKLVFTKIVPIGYDMFVVYRNAAGANGPAKYYLNDWAVFTK